MYDLIYKGRERYGPRWGAQYSLHLFMYYDAGQAAALARAHTELDFWHMQNYGYEGFRRGTERRHFRGDKGKQAMLTFQRMGSPVDIWVRMHSKSYTGLVHNLKSKFEGTQTGPYFAWKAMDILDRCLGYPVTLDVNEALRFMPDEPRKCAATLWPNHTLHETLEIVKGLIHDLPAQGAPGKLCGYAEAETVLCAALGWVKGSYKFGSDIDRRHEQLKDYPDLQALLPPKQDWSQYVRAVDAA